MNKEEIEQCFPIGKRVYCSYMGEGPAYRPYRVLGQVEEVKDSILRVRSKEVPNTTLDYDFSLIKLDKSSPVIPAEMVIENQAEQEG